jgi:hypothetical protein
VLGSNSIWKKKKETKQRMKRKKRREKKYLDNDDENAPMHSIASSQRVRFGIVLHNSIHQIHCNIAQ